MAKRKTTEKFIEESKIVHGDEFSYENSIYILNSEKVEIICKKHGSFWMLPNVHIIQKSKCPSCMGSKKKTTTEFINEATTVHGNKFSYNQVIYKNNSTKIDILCNSCNLIFSQIPTMHLQGQGCPVCYGNKKIDFETFYNNVKKIHNNYYQYIYDYTSLRNPITVICPIHGSFKQRAQSHYKGHKCQKCAKAGFDKDKPSYFYVQEIYNNDILICYKFGITNNTPEQRMKSQSYHTKYDQKLVFSFKDNGVSIHNLEAQIKKIFKINQLSKDEFGDGYTETISLEFIELLENEIINFITNNQKK